MKDVGEREREGDKRETERGRERRGIMRKTEREEG